MKGNITVSQLAYLLDTKNIKLIDVREPYEYKSGHIKKCINVPVSLIINSPDKYISKDEKVYIICKVGSRSANVCNILSKKGYDVVNVLGGYKLWPGKILKK